MSQFFTVHPQQPQQRLMHQAAAMLCQGALIAFPTDSAYALGGHLGDSKLLERIRQLREVDDSHLFTLMCRDLSQIASYAKVDNKQFRLLKAVTPGAYTFILEGSKELPRRVLHPRRKTLGLRIPAHPVVSALLTELNEPILTSTLLLPEDDLPLTDPEMIREKIGKRVDLIIDAGSCSANATTVIDLTSGEPVLVRKGLGALAPLGLQE